MLVIVHALVLPGEGDPTDIGPLAVDDARRGEEDDPGGWEGEEPVPAEKRSPPSSIAEVVCVVSDAETMFAEVEIVAASNGTGARTLRSSPTDIDGASEGGRAVLALDSSSWRDSH